MAACQWLLDLQMADAYQQVATGKTLKEISGAIGFKPLSHLSKRFKEHFGVSPSLLNANGRLAPPNPGARRRNAKNKKQYYG